jgi:carbonic anhydrase
MGQLLPCSQGSRLDRRRFLEAPAAAVAGLLGGAVACGYAMTKEQRDQLTPAKVLADLKRGNARFRKGESTKRNYLAEQKASAKGQYPAAVILSCIDSRAPAEVILDQGIGYIFNCRVAGNVVNDDMLGSMEFACKVAGAKVILIMGHTSCGAIQGAIEKVELGNLTGLLAKIHPAVQATVFPGKRSAKDLAFVDEVARKHVELTMTQVLARSTVLRELQSKGAIKLAGALYNLETAKVDFF